MRRSVFFDFLDNELYSVFQSDSLDPHDDLWYKQHACRVLSAWNESERNKIFIHAFVSSTTASGYSESLLKKVLMFHLGSIYVLTERY